MKKKLVSIVTPVYNEEENAELYYQRMRGVIDTLSDRYDFEFVITDNCSTDSTFSIFKRLAESDHRIRVFRFSRNFGYQKSIWTGYSLAKGDAAIEFDCDLQDPPELLSLFLEKWEEGSKITYGIRRKRQEGYVITLLRKVFYRLINAISDQYLPPDAGDFMLIDRKIIDHLATIQDQNLYLRGYEQVGIPYKRDAREHGVSKFPMRKMIGLAMDGIISQSTLPLKIASYTGFLVAITTLLMSAFFIIYKLAYGADFPRGFTTTAILILFSVSLNAIFLGIIGEYISRIYLQLKRRPLTIIEDSVDYS
jgi:dolichol-phosphate mannosyltransferase